MNTEQPAKGGCCAPKMASLLVGVFAVSTSSAFSSTRFHSSRRQASHPSFLPLHFRE
jgi:hypothetical protein